MTEWYAGGVVGGSESSDHSKLQSHVAQADVTILCVRVQRFESQLPVIDVLIVLMHRSGQRVLHPHGVGLVALAVRLDDSMQRSDTVVGARAFGVLVALEDLESLVLLARGRRPQQADEHMEELHARRGRSGVVGVQHVALDGAAA